MADRSCRSPLVGGRAQDKIQYRVVTQRQARRVFAISVFRYGFGADRHVFMSLFVSIIVPQIASINITLVV
jgi:hypothetical protein